MLKIPSALREQFELCLRNKPVPVSAHGLYIKWLRYYLDFCLQYDFASDQRESLPHFLRKLQEKNQSKAQQQQAAETITFYYELILSMGHNEAAASPQETISPGRLPVRLHSRRCHRKRKPGAPETSLPETEFPTSPPIRPTHPRKQGICRQELLGHSSIKTTRVYTHTVKSTTIKEAKSPLDI